MPPTRSAISRLGAAFLGLGLLLGGCGFQPLYGGGDQGTAAKLAAVQVNTIPDRSGQKLRTALIDSLGRGEPADSPAYALDVALSTFQGQTALQKDATATRAQVQLTATFFLRDRSGAALFRGTSQTVVGYNILPGPYATVVNADDAMDRAIRQLSGDITRRLALYFSRGPVSQ